MFSSFEVESIDSLTFSDAQGISQNGLPIVSINTPNSIDITSKEEYVTGATLSITNTELAFGLDEEIKIKGRGNSTWLEPKKPYKIKFQKGQSLFGEAADKEWVFLANYLDKTMLKNALAFYMGQHSTLDYTSSFHFVDLVLNGKYNGTYMIAEQLKIAKHRVNVGDDGFLIEVDARADSSDILFHTPHMAYPFIIKDPDVTEGDEAYTYVKNYVNMADSVLYSTNFTDADTGWTKYIDDDSFVEWYLINEIARNNDACMFLSCYMNLSRTGKLKMGPIWDFDLAFGNYANLDNHNHLTDGFYIKKSQWINRMFKDPAFVQKVKHRMTYYYDNKQKWLDQIDLMAADIYISQAENEEVWKTMDKSLMYNYYIFGSFEAAVNYLKDWLSKRLDWLQTHIQALP